MRRVLALWLAAGLLSGCGGYFGTETDGPPLPGKRLSVLALERAIKPDPRVAGLEIKLPTADRNKDWPQPGGIPSHVMHHLAAGAKLVPAWEVDIGSGSSSDTQLLAQPVSDGRLVYTVDVDAEVRAYDLKTGKRVWRVDLEPDEDDDGILGGGLAVSDGRLFLTTGFAEVFALDAATGKKVWQRKVNGPMRSGPTVYGGRVFVVTIANELFALSADDGRQLWTHEGLLEGARLMGGAAPAAGAGVVIVPYSSGEVVALRVENGRVLWNESLPALRQSDPVSAIAHIRGAPVIDRDRVFAVSHSGRMVAIDLRTGARIWEQSFGGTQPPWVVGDYLYMITGNNEVVCLLRSDGRIRWVRPLPRFEDEEDKEGPLTWAGPVLAGGRLIVAGSNEEIRFISPFSGEPLGKMEAPGPILIQPAVAQETVLVLSDDADLLALR